MLRSTRSSGLADQIRGAFDHYPYRSAGWHLAGGSSGGDVSEQLDGCLRVSVYSIRSIYYIGHSPVGGTTYTGCSHSTAEVLTLSNIYIYIYIYIYINMYIFIAIVIIICI